MASSSPSPPLARRRTRVRASSPPSRPSAARLPPAPGARYLMRSAAAWATDGLPSIGEVPSNYDTTTYVDTWIRGTSTKPYRGLWRKHFTIGQQGDPMVHGLDTHWGPGQVCLRWTDEQEARIAGCTRTAREVAS